MPTDSMTSDFHDTTATLAPRRNEDSRQLPDGAGLAIGVIAGAAIWVGVLAFVLI